MNENDILYEIDEFESGKDFISLGINLAKYDIVFLDVNMDELDGMETAQKIRKVSNDVFIVFVYFPIFYYISAFSSKILTITLYL